MDWEDKFKKAGAFWEHDGNKLRPYARLTSGRISNRFFNADNLIDQPDVIAQAAGHLVHHPVFAEALKTLRRERKAVRTRSSQSDDDTIVIHEDTRAVTRVQGAAYGSITLAHEIARHIGCRFAFTTKATKMVEWDGVVREVIVPGKMSLARFADRFREGEVVVFVEDTITTGGTMAETKQKVREAAPNAIFVPCILALCNRSGKESIDGMRIASLISPEFPSWEEGCNPFTADGKELVPPLKAKGKNWEILNRKYE